MNLVQLVQDVCFEAGINGAAGITDVTVLTGRQLQVLQWVNKAWMQIQRRHDIWKFMRFTLSFQTVNNQWQYNGGGNESTAPVSPLVVTGTTPQILQTAPPLHRLVKDSFRIYDNVAGIQTEVRLQFTEWDPFRELFRFSAVQLQQRRPTYISHMPNRDVALALVPDVGAGSGYTVYGDYYTKPQPFVTQPGSVGGVTWTVGQINAQAPWFPEEFHEVITWLAVWRYGGFAEANAIYVNAMNQAKQIMTALAKDQLPDPEEAAPLA